MGFAVDQEESTLQSFGSAVDALIAWDCGFKGWHEGVAKSPVLAAFATLQAAIWCHVLSEITPGQAALIVTHGGMIEAGVMVAAQTFAWSTAGEAIGCAEGVRLWFEEQQCVHAIVLRFNRDREEQSVIR